MKDKQTCYICDQVCEEGIDILGSYICKNCEEEMINEDASELKMEYYRSKIKSLWRNNLS